MYVYTYTIIWDKKESSRFSLLGGGEKKEERQNNPEIELNESQFIALERDKRRERYKSIKDFENKGGCQGTHILTYGTAPEQRSEKIQELAEIKELDNNSESKKQSHHE